MENNHRLPQDKLTKFGINLPICWFLGCASSTNKLVINYFRHKSSTLLFPLSLSNYIWYYLLRMYRPKLWRAKHSNKMQESLSPKRWFLRFLWILFLAYGQRVMRILHAIAYRSTLCHRDWKTSLKGISSNIFYNSKYVIGFKGLCKN